MNKTTIGNHQCIRNLDVIHACDVTYINIIGCLKFYNLLIGFGHYRKSGSKSFFMYLVSPFLYIDDFLGNFCIELPPKKWN